MFFRSSLILLPEGCSCSRKPGSDATFQRTTLPPAAHQPEASQDPALQRRQQMETEQARTMREAASMMHSYLGALASGNHTVADAMWVSGRPPPTPGDAALCALGPRSMRINTDVPKPLDPDQVPARSLGIPIRLRMLDPDGTVRNWSG